MEVEVVEAVSAVLPVLHSKTKCTGKDLPLTVLTRYDSMQRVLVRATRRVQLGGNAVVRAVVKLAR